MYTSEVNEILKNAGWHKGRNVLSQLKLPYDDYPKFALIFLKNYGLLKGPCVARPEWSDVVNHFIIQPETPEKELVGDHVIPYYSGLLNTKLFPLGGVDSGGGYEICCDSNENCYMLGEYCFFVGSDIITGIDRVLDGDSREYLQLDEDNLDWYNMLGEKVAFPD